MTALEEEVEQAFHACWTTGSLDEDWDLAGARVAYELFAAEVDRCGGRGLERGRLERLQAERRAATLEVFARGG